MLPEDYYKVRLTELQKQLASLTRKKSTLGWLRLATVICLFTSLYFFWSHGLLLIVVSCLLLLTAFVRLIFADSENNYALQHNKQLIKITEDELRALRHDYHHFMDGNQFIEAGHPYANDLDILGR